MNLKRIRQSKNMSQKEVADLINCSPVVYSRYETGARQPSFDTLVRLAEIFGVTCDELLGVSSETPSSVKELNSYEINLVEASRKADERAREDALALLRVHELKS